MQIILLSGGSGKRLWPLSNDTRSKQFLQILTAPDGGAESMVQRVVRQAREAQLNGEITLATNATQVDMIINQLGETVGTVTEPERRDTFPAIALAATYLKLEKQCADDEVVVVMPSDPYTEIGYFQTIREMVKAVEADAAKLLLMGITPTYPSPKFGYVVPTEGSSATAEHNWMMVRRFEEKPTVEHAEELLAEGALWNGGVFAFRLGYIMNIVRKYVQYATFAETRANYRDFPKISFDYEVAEKAESVAVVPFTGEWKDLGTWNALTTELRSGEIGNAVQGEHCENVHVVNELATPIFVEGLKDTVVAASPDGILVCGKEYTEGIKKQVEHLTERPMFEERRWGYYRVIDATTYTDGYKSLSKVIHLGKGKHISYQVHHHRSEVWTFVDGEGLFLLDGNITPVRRGMTVIVPCEHYHSIKALTDLTFIEVQSGDMLVEEDIERVDFDWSKYPHA